MADVFLGCTGGEFEQFSTLSGQQIRCTGTLENITPIDLYNQLMEVGGGGWMEVIFSTPATEDIQAAFMAGFGLPVICFLVSWAYQTVINFAEKDEY